MKGSFLLLASGPCLLVIMLLNLCLRLLIRLLNTLPVFSPFPELPDTGGLTAPPRLVCASNLKLLFLLTLV